VRLREVVLPVHAQVYRIQPQFGQDYGQNLSQPTRPAWLSAVTRLQLLVEALRLRGVLALGNVVRGQKAGQVRIGNMGKQKTRLT